MAEGKGIEQFYLSGSLKSSLHILGDFYFAGFIV